MSNTECSYAVSSKVESMCAVAKGPHHRSCAYS